MKANNTYRVVIQRIQISVYYVEGECDFEARMNAIAQANNDDWSNDFAQYLPISCIREDEPF